MNKYFKLYWTFRIYRIFNRYKNHPKDNSIPKCYIFLAADYGNLGDIAITYAQREMLKMKYPEHMVIEIQAKDTQPAIHWLKRNIKKDDIITIVGGGNMGDLYGDIELHRLMVIESFKNNKIILFPQTIDYSNSNESEWLKKFSQKVYDNHKHIIMMAREIVSYNTMKELYPHIDIRLTPDIVMTLDQRSYSTKRLRNLITYCLRNDEERSNIDNLILKASDQLEQVGYKIEYYDTHIGGDRYTEEKKYKELNKIWNQFRRSQLIITDRLHGMIFAYITGTPAIVFRNSNFKVQECYKWIKDCGYIYFVDQEEELSINKFIECKKDRFFETRENIIKIFNKTL